MPPLCEIYLPHPPHQLKTSSVILSVKPAPRAGPSSQPRDLGCDQTRISILTTQRQPSANLHRQYVWGSSILDQRGHLNRMLRSALPFFVDATFCANACSNAAAPRARSVGRRFMPPRRGSDSNGAKSHVKGRSWDRLASQDLSPSVSQGTIWRYVAVDRRLGYA